MNKITLTEEEYFEAIFEDSDRFKIEYRSDFYSPWAGDKYTTRDIVLWDSETEKYYMTYAERGIGDGGEYWFRKDMGVLQECKQVEVTKKEWQVIKNG